MLKTKRQLQPYFWTTVRYLLLIVIVSALGWVINLLWYKPFNINLFYERTFLEYGRERPELLTQIHYYELLGMGGHNSRLNDVSDKQQTKDFEVAIKYFEMLSSYKRAEQNKEQQLSTEILDYYFQDKILHQQFLYHDYAIDHLTGLQVNFPLFMLHYHQINDIKDAENYLKCLSLVSKKIKQTIQGILIREEYRAIPPKAILKQCIEQIRRFIRGGVYENILYHDFKKKLSQLKNISQQARNEYLYDVKGEIEDNVIPAFLNLAKELAKVEAIDAGEVGVSKFDDGEYFYAYLLQKYLTVDQLAITVSLTTDSLISLAQQQIDLAQREIDKISDQLAMDKDSNVLFDTINTNRFFFYENNNHGKLAYLSDFSRLIKKYKNLSAQYFDIENISDSVHLAFMWDFQERFLPLYTYYPGSLKNTKPAIFYINFYDTWQHAKYTLATAVVRYIFPGLHLQMCIQQQADHLPTFRRAFSFHAFNDGWQLYALKLACEEDMFEDIYSVLFAYYTHIISAYKLIIDIKINKEKWTRKQSIDYLIEQTGLPQRAAKIAVDECIVKPGKAPAALVGYAKIMELRKIAKSNLGKKFMLKDFHRALLKNGSVPLHVIDKAMQEYMQSH